MGLDMYLYAEKYVGGTDWDEEAKTLNEKVRKLFPEMFKSGNLNSVKVSFEAGYWRKANHIHQWFVDNCQDGVDDCRVSYVSRENLEQLKELCVTAVANKDMAETALPTQGGFFFGNTDYDEWYFKDCEDTIKIIDKCLELPSEWRFFYQSSW